MKTIKRLFWYWKQFWGTRYIIIYPDKTEQEILVYHRKIYFMR